ncbi:MBL fold metallo-hydrolase [Halobacillus locisalis]|uniref:MBL fold metallo-hydrolase n=1 Tax=Halobacillus locisalis TaxID=220753 RepID=A0A838CT26_9BACI|nr:MBL fold metallo-hydrolase [Halobacillus locisalis]MBA2175094.1 MBL fold metallo-hydrolase [Halobacillus locisalis]
MFFKSFFDENLAQMSYMVGCQRTGEALVIDPARDLSPYLETAEKEGFNITKAAETHIHADFLSGARELANNQEVTLLVSGEGGDDWSYQYLNETDHQLLKDNDTFYVGNIRLDVLHTPGHTPESISFLLTDEGGGSEVPMGIFTGDFVFVGDVGRPDLLEKAAGEAGTSQSGAKQMFESLQRFKQLSDHIQVWPGHGAGSACGKSLGAVPSSTVGYERINNWALQYDEESSFMDELLDGQPEPPKYFAMMKKLNKEGPSLVKDRAIQELSIEKIDDYRSEDYVILDTRSKEAFKEGHLPGAINISYDKSLPNWAGWTIGYDQSIVLISPLKDVSGIKKQLESIGLDDVVAVLDAEKVENQSDLETYENITPRELEAQYRGNDDYVIVDVRNQNEWNEGHIAGAERILLGELQENIDQIPSGKTPIVHCQSGKRSAIAASVLQANGFKDVLNLTGGFSAYAKEYEPVTT